MAKKHFELKFLTCSILTIFQDDLLSSIQNFEQDLFYTYLADLILAPPILIRNENPTAFLFITLDWEYPREYVYDMDYFKNLDVTSTFLVLSKYSAFLICMNCEERLTEIFTDKGAYSQILTWLLLS